MCLTEFLFTPISVTRCSGYIEYTTRYQWMLTTNPFMPYPSSQTPTRFLDIAANLRFNLEEVRAGYLVELRAGRGLEQDPLLITTLDWKRASLAFYGSALAFYGLYRLVK